MFSFCLLVHLLPRSPPTSSSIHHHPRPQLRLLLVQSVTGGQSEPGIDPESLLAGLNAQRIGGVTGPETMDVPSVNLHDHHRHPSNNSFFF
ncbi:hypothetical protein BO82DRAFT_54976 [Aspergillus uvarum CBS 121591]|uniref:Uncharacterized protein n=1 Tax=Aspergillus uvarum CBS 121591 TaxID=1448315 RepID=A0A319CR80_9EURO|nr:hypothetical protein BO82DRAFT_54976 [Aspergillus uvarum CBS 121591]PYH86959.1 hypothetical protein BO82DRAFT_54976 [Aspergillus uvarum CBS 121591]